MPDLVVAGAGMAGLAAAARARELGASVTVYEKGDRPGGSMLLSSGVVWRHRELERFRAECPGGDPELQRVLYEQLDDALDWLETVGAPVLERDTGNPLTVGRRFDTRGLTDALVRRAGEPRLGEPLRGLPDGVPVVLATGGFQGDRELVRRHVTPEADHLLLRANRWSSGDGLRLGLAAGAEVERRDGVTSVEVVAAITATLGGLRVDASARAADGVFAAGTDAGGVSTGGYSSGLAAALMFGRIAAETALRS
jgi:succinate dehydrogenase/fumarate reductase flavoprotein subunit